MKNIPELKIGDVLFIYEFDQPIFGVIKPKRDALNKDNDDADLGDGRVLYVEWEDGIKTTEYKSHVVLFDFSNIEYMRNGCYASWFGNIRDQDIEKKKLVVKLKLST